MARKRMLDPGLWRDPKVIQLTNDELVVFIGCISIGDDEGILEPNPHSLYFELARTELPPEKIELAIDRIAEQGLIVRYGPYAFLPNWYKHQNLKGRKPQETKLRRPPKEVLEQFPHYVEEWCSTFVRKVDGDWVPRDYPYRTCYTPATISDSPVAAEQKPQERGATTSESPVATEQSASQKAATTGDSPVTHQCATGDSPVTPNRSEVKGSEVKGILNGSTPPEMPPWAEPSNEGTDDAEHAPSAPSEDPQPANGRSGDSKAVALADRGAEIYDELFHGFEQLQPDRRYANYGREGKAVKRLIAEARARSPDDPAQWLREAVATFQRLRDGPDEFWRKQPLLPSVLSSGGILPRVLEEMHQQSVLGTLDWLQEGAG